MRTPATATEDRPAAPARPVTALRGAGVEVDPRRVALLAGALVVVVLAVAGVVLGIAGAEKNAQATELLRQGEPGTVTVTSCTGLMGGSGSNLAGYDCRGLLVLDGRRYAVSVPGDAAHRPGDRVAVVTVASDPALLSTSAALRSERASWRVFIAPAVLALGAVVVAVAVAAARRRPGAYLPPEETGGE